MTTPESNEDWVSSTGCHHIQEALADMEAAGVTMDENGWQWAAEFVTSSPPDTEASPQTGDGNEGGEEGVSGEEGDSGDESGY